MYPKLLDLFLSLEIAYVVVFKCFIIKYSSFSFNIPQFHSFNMYPRHMTRSQRMVLLALDSKKSQSSANNKSTPKFDPFEFDPDPFDVDKHRNVSYSDVSIILRSLTAIIYFIHVLYYLKIILVQFIYFIHA